MNQLSVAQLQTGPAIRGKLAASSQRALCRGILISSCRERIVVVEACVYGGFILDGPRKITSSVGPSWEH